MLDPDICSRCHRESARRRGAVGVLGFNPNVWACCRMVDNGITHIDVAGVMEDSDPPEGCYHMFEQAIAAGMKGDQC